MHEDDPFRIACCESCCSFRRHADGLPLCLAVLATVEERAARDRALRGTNALNRCRLFTPLDTTDKPGEQP